MFKQEIFHLLFSKNLPDTMFEKSIKIKMFYEQNVSKKLLKKIQNPLNSKFIYVHI